MTALPPPAPKETDRSKLKCYAQAIAMWCSRFDTADIASHLGIPESMVARWIANYRDVVRAE